MCIRDRFINLGILDHFNKLLSFKIFGTQILTDYLFLGDVERIKSDGYPVGVDFLHQAVRIKDKWSVDFSQYQIHGSFQDVYKRQTSHYPMVNSMRYLILSLALFSGWSSEAQVISLEEVLGTAIEDQNVIRYQSIRDMASDLKMHDPLVKEIALRIGFNGSVLGDTIYGYLRNEDDLRLQVSFNALGVRQKQKQVKSARLQTLTTRQGVLTHSALTDRYEALSEYV